MTAHRSPDRKSIVRNAEEAASEIEKAKGVFNDLLEYDEKEPRRDLQLLPNPLGYPRQRVFRGRTARITIRKPTMPKNNPETLALAMDYAAAMEACAAYVQVSKPAIREPDAVYKIVRPIIDAATGGDKQESFMVLLLNTKNRLIMTPVEATRGLLDTSPVHPREVFREAVRHSAAGVILAHNHLRATPPRPKRISTSRAAWPTPERSSESACSTTSSAAGRATPPRLRQPAREKPRRLQLTHSPGSARKNGLQGRHNKPDKVPAGRQSREPREHKQDRRTEPNIKPHKEKERMNENTPHAYYACEHNVEECLKNGSFVRRSKYGWVNTPSETSPASSKPCPKAWSKSTVTSPARSSECCR
jgi:hypothetical protein